MRGNTGYGICPECRTGDVWSHILRCNKGTWNWRDNLLEKNSTSVVLKIRIRKIVSNKSKVRWMKIGKIFKGNININGKG
jgi:hypothetical protein